MAMISNSTPAARNYPAGKGPSSFGRLLREWRSARGLSQLELALAADVSSRHVSFLETGRSTPSREMVLLLGDVLEVPLRQRNDLLEAAGFAAAYRETTLEAPAMARLRKVLDYILHGSEPNPTFVLDRWQDIVTTNRGMERFLRTFLGTIPRWHVERPNYVRLVFHPEGLRRWIVNWEEVARALLGRVHREAALVGSDRRMQDLLRELLSYPDIPSRWAAPDPHAEVTVAIPLHLVSGALDLRLFSTVTTVGAPRDVTAQELRIECFIPADDASEAAVLRLEAGAR